MTYARIALVVPLVLSCSNGPDSGSDASVTETSSSSSGAQTGTESSGSSTSAGPATTGSSTGTSTDVTTSGSSTTATTGAELPPLCTKTSQCGQGKYCLQKDCEDVDNEPGCGELRCYSACSSPFDESAFWHCADMQACCGGYPCEGGQCTEHFEPTEGG